VTGCRRSLTSPTTDAGQGPGAPDHGAARLDIGRVVKPHGLTGEVVVELWTNVAGRLSSGARFTTGDGELVVESARPHQGRYLVRFGGVADRSAAEALRGAVVRADAVDVEGALFVHELVGSQAVAVGGRRLGCVVAVEANPASDLLVLDSGALVPLRFVTDLDPGRTVTVDVPAGLVE
jgi:16S rRNA processing protein RimM